MGKRQKKHTHRNTPNKHPTNTQQHARTEQRTSACDCPAPAPQQRSSRSALCLADRCASTLVRSAAAADPAGAPCVQRAWAAGGRMSSTTARAMKSESSSCWLCVVC